MTFAQNRALLAVAGFAVVLLFVVGLLLGILLAGGSSSEPPSIAGMTTRSAVARNQTATPEPTGTATPIPATPQPEQPLVTPQLIVITAPPVAPATAPPTAEPTLPPIPTPAPATPPPPPPASPPPTYATWPEIAEVFRDTQNTYYDSIKTNHSITLPGLGTLKYTNQYYMPSCEVQSWNEADRAWIIRCDVGVLIKTPGFQDEYRPSGSYLFKLFADTGNAIQL
jgi:hypothetical protein